MNEQRDGYKWISKVMFNAITASVWFLETLVPLLCCAFLLYPAPLSTVMEPSQIVGGAEECSETNSSESGWTSYIASPIEKNNHDDDDDDDDQQGDIRKGNWDNDGHDGESDDSMASDASSGPSGHELWCRSNEGSPGMDILKHDNKYLSRQKPHKQVKQRDGARIKMDKEESMLNKEGSVFKAKSAASCVQSGTKVRKTN